MLSIFEVRQNMPITKHYYETLYSNPVFSLKGFCKKHLIDGEIFAYFAGGGATNTLKDSLAQGILALAAEKGQLKANQNVLEASSGSFAVALAIACSYTNHPLILCMPSSVPPERREFFAKLGAKVVILNYANNRDIIISRAKQIAIEQDAYFVNYFDNDFNAEFHRRITGPSLLRATGNDVDAIVMGVGSGGTITGVGEYAKAWVPDVKIIAVEPYECQAITKNAITRHKIPGLGAGFVPENYNPYIVDAVMAVPSENAIQASFDVLLTDAIPACVSGGAVLSAAAQLMREQTKIKRVACIIAGKTTYE